MEVFLLHHARLAEGELALVTPRLDVEILPLVLLLLAHLLHPLLQHGRQVLNGRKGRYKICSYRSSLQDFGSRSGLTMVRGEKYISGLRDPNDFKHG